LYFKPFTQPMHSALKENAIHERNRQLYRARRPVYKVCNTHFDTISSAS
jgi:hypothetical protein